jgi:ubiquinone/menaquinone biosynthesis C-methylase UbiE
MLDALQKIIHFQRASESEIIDTSDHDPVLLAANFADMRRTNRWLGGIRLTLQALESLLPEGTANGELTLLDVGAGSLDVAAAVSGWATDRDFTSRVVATDISLQILTLFPRVGVASLVTADARRLPFADGSFDVVTSSMLLHHLNRPDAIAALREMGRVARRGVIVNDLVRGRLWYLAALVLSRVSTRNPLTRHDAPLSVRRAYTVRELTELSGSAGLVPIRAGRFLGYRVAMTFQLAKNGG